MTLIDPSRRAPFANPCATSWLPTRAPYPFSRARGRAGGSVRTNPKPGGSWVGGVAEFFPEYITPSSSEWGYTLREKFGYETDHTPANPSIVKGSVVGRCRNLWG